MNQKQWSGSAAPNVFFVQYAEELGLDVEKFKDHMKSSLLRDAIRADLEEGRDLDITGTPTFYLNGEKMDINSFEDFILKIAAAVDPAAAAALQASSTASTTDTSTVKFGL